MRSDTCGSEENSKSSRADVEAGAVRQCGAETVLFLSLCT